MKLNNGAILDFFNNGTPKLVFVSATTTNGDVTVSLRPAAGKKYFLLFVYGYHDDTTARLVYWQFYDGTNTMEWPQAGKSLNGSLYLGLELGPAAESVVGASKFQGVIDRDTYLQFKGAALATGKKVYIRALVLELDD